MYKQGQHRYRYYSWEYTCIYIQQVERDVEKIVDKVYTQTAIGQKGNIPVILVPLQPFTVTDGIFCEYKNKKRKNHCMRTHIFEVLGAPS